MAKRTPAVEVDYIEVVRQHLADMKAGPDRTRLALDAGVTTATLDNIRDNKTRPAYETILNLYQLIKASRAQSKGRAK